MSIFPSRSVSRPRLRLLLRPVVCLLATGALAAVATAEDPQPAPIPGNSVAEGLGREGMWPAPTAEDWAKPVLITFQRTWDDAVSVSKATGHPILVCINMDGEIASEHFAGVRYRQPEVARLYDPYVPVIASVYRHNPRDYDDEGRRILCPRFGSVTCGEHIAIEPVIYEKFCDGQRVAPRHIMVDLEGNETYDVFYVNDTRGVFEAIHDGIANLEEPLPPIVRGDRPVIERVQSRDVRDRSAVEAAYRSGDATQRDALLQAALKHPEAAPLDLLRLAIFGLDADRSQAAREALAQADSPQAIGLLSDALRVPMDTAERDRLIAALKRIGESSTLARWLAVVHRGLVSRSAAVDVSGWAEGAGGTYPAPMAPEGTDLGSFVERTAREASARADDPDARLDLADATLALAMEAPRIHATDPGRARLFQRHLFSDALRQADEAEALGATGWRLRSIQALASYYAGNLEAAYERAEEAVKDLPPGDPSWNSMAVLTVFAEGRWKAIRKAARAKEDWPPEWLTDVHAAYSVLLRHPLGTADQVLWHYELMVWLGADNKAQGILERGLDRFEDSEALHARLRESLLKHRGAEEMEAAYDDFLAEGETPTLLWFAALASTDAAEHYRKVRRWNDALDAYARSIARQERVLELSPQAKPAVDHAVALGRAGRARVEYQLNHDAEALAEIILALRRSPDTAGTRDGMGITPGETAQMLLARLEEGERAPLARKLAEALGAVDVELLRPDGE